MSFFSSLFLPCHSLQCSPQYSWTQKLEESGWPTRFLEEAAVSDGQLQSSGSLQRMRPVLSPKHNDLQTFHVPGRRKLHRAPEGLSLPVHGRLPSHIWLVQLGSFLQKRIDSIWSNLRSCKKNKKKISPIIKSKKPQEGSCPCAWVPDRLVRESRDLPTRLRTCREGGPPPGIPRGPISVQVQQADEKNENYFWEPVNRNWAHLLSRSPTLQRSMPTEESFWRENEK